MIVVCEDCEGRINTGLDIYHIVEERYYCDFCFRDKYYRCEVCQVIRYLDGDWWWVSEEDETRECNDCHQSKHSLYPSNPDITDSDRAVILKFAKQFVETVGVVNTYKLRVKKGDYRMEEIKTAIGDIPAPIYLFGIKDEKAYRVLATSDIIDLVREYFKDKEHIVSFNEIRLNKGYMRLGLDRSLREIHFDKCIELVKYIVSNKKKMKKANIRRGRAHTNDPEIGDVPLVGVNEAQDAASQCTVNRHADHIEAAMLQNPNVNRISSCDIDILNRADRVRFCYADDLWEHVTLNIKLECIDNGYRIIRIVPTSNPDMLATMPEDQTPGRLMGYIPTTIGVRR